MEEINGTAKLMEAQKEIIRRLAREHAEMKAAMEKVAAMRSNSGSFLAAQEIIVDALNKINAKG